MDVWVCAWYVVFGVCVCVRVCACVCVREREERDRNQVDTKKIQSCTYNYTQIIFHFLDYIDSLSGSSIPCQ